jgi:hypothetical protein
LDEEGAEKIVTVQDAADMIEIVKNAQWKKSVWSHCGLCIVALLVELYYKAQVWTHDSIRCLQ